jgi:hypothetical protein
MAEMRTAHDKGETVTRLTLFPPSGKPVTQLIREYYYDERGVLQYGDSNGIRHETTLPFAIEHITKGHQKAPFQGNSGGHSEDEAARRAETKKTLDNYGKKVGS